MTAAVPDPGEAKPGKVQAIAIMNLVDGILNIFWSFGVAIFILSLGVATFGIGCIILPLAAYPLVVGILAIVNATRLLSNNTNPVAPARGLAVMQIINILSGNIVSLGVGIAGLVLYNDPEVQAFFTGNAGSKA